MYCTRTDVERRWGAVNVSKWADLDNDQNAGKIQAQIDWAIQTVEDRLDFDLASSGYYIPFAPVPSIVVCTAAALVGALLYNARAINLSVDQINPNIKGVEEAYQNWLTSVYSGTPITGARRV